MTPDFAWLFVKMVAALLVVLVFAIILIRFFLPRIRGGRPFWGKGRIPEWASVLGRFTLEPRKHLYLVKVMGRYLVLGAGERSLTVVTELRREEGEGFENPQK